MANRRWMGGVPTYLRNLEKSLLEFGVEIHVADEVLIERKDAWALLGQYSRHMLDVYSPRRYGSLVIMQAARLVCEAVEEEIHECDLVHAQDPFVALSMRKKHPGAIIILTIHGLNYEHMLESLTLRRGWKPLVRRAIGYDSFLWRRMRSYECEGISSADHIIAVDTNHALKALKMGVPTSRVSVILNAVDVKFLQTLSERASIFNMSKPYFLMLRRLSPKNGVEFGVRAFLSWVGNRDIRLVIAGDGQCRDQINSECLAHRSGNKVIFLGVASPDNIPALIKGSIATLVPSVPVGGVIEATSLAALESLALGIPVIASDIGGLSEIDGGKNVMNLVPPASVKHIVLELEKIYEDYQKGTIDREAKRKHVMHNFDVKIWVEKIHEVYENAIIQKIPFSNISNKQDRG